MPESCELDYTRTVDRHLVHRWSVSEVFLTDVRTISADRFAAAAQLPTSHSYYGDQARADGTVDPMLLMECFRQAATWIAHRCLEVPRDTSFLVTDWKMPLDRPARIEPAGRPGQLRIDIEIAQVLNRGGCVRGARFLGQLILDGSPIGQAEVAARYVPAAESVAVRGYHRESRPPLSTSLPDRPLGQPVEPRLVGRRRPENVVLFDVEHHCAATGASLGTCPDHRGFYDHPQDHYTAMILFEAARQIALFDDGAREQAAEPDVIGLAGRFHYYAELDSPVRLWATPRPTGSAVEIRQNGRVVAEIDVTLVRDGADD